MLPAVSHRRDTHCNWRTKAALEGDQPTVLQGSIGILRLAYGLSARREV